MSESTMSGLDLNVTAARAWAAGDIVTDPITTPHVEALMPTFHITVHGADREAMADLVRTHRVRVLPQTLDEGGPEPRVDAMADQPTIRRLTDAGFRVDQHEDVDEAARDDLEQVGQGNRFAAELAAMTEAEEERS